VFSHIFKRPRPNQSWRGDKVVTHHEEETWLQLFIDLIYVAFFMTLGKGIAYCEHYENETEADVLGAAGLLFALLFGLRYDIDLYANRFHSRDLVTRVLYFFFTCGVVIMALHIYRVDSGDACPQLGLQNKAEPVGFIIAYSAIVILNAIALYSNPLAQPQLGFEFFTSLVYLVCTMIITGPIEPGKLTDFFRIFVPLSYILRTEFLGQYIRPYFNKYLGPYLFVKEPGPLELKRDIIPLNIHVHQVRLVMFIMIATGEGMIQIIYPSMPNDKSFVDRIYAFVVACVVILFSLAMLYADAVVRNPHNGEHAMLRKNKVAGALWTYSHVVLGFFIFLTGICIELAISLVYKNQPIHHSYDSLLGACLGSATLIMTLMRSTHKGISTEELSRENKDKGIWSKHLRRKINYSFRIIISLVHYLLAYFEWQTGSADTDDTSSGTYFSPAADSSTDDNTNYHNVRSQDKFYYLHASFLALSLLIEVAGSFLCKKNDRNSFVRRSFARSRQRTLASEEEQAAAEKRPSRLQSNPLNDTDEKSEDEKL